MIVCVQLNLNLLLRHRELMCRIHFRTRTQFLCIEKNQLIVETLNTSTKLSLQNYLLMYNCISYDVVDFRMIALANLSNVLLVNIIIVFGKNKFLISFPCYKKKLGSAAAVTID